MGAQHYYMIITQIVKAFQWKISIVIVVDLALADLIKRYRRGWLRYVWVKPKEKLGKRYTISTSRLIHNLSAARFLLQLGYFFQRTV